jgi:hypothetical protein
MLHKRYVVRYLMKSRWDQEDSLTEFCSDLTYLDRKDAEDFANSVRGLAVKVQLNEFIADFQVPAVLIPYEWLR